MPEFPSQSPPVRNKIGEIILRGVVAPDLEDRSQETIEEADPTEDEGERRNTVGTPLHVDNSEGPQQEAALDVVAEVVRMRTQLQQIIVEREAERGHGNVSDTPPAYV